MAKNEDKDTPTKRTLRRIGIAVVVLIALARPVMYLVRAMHHDQYNCGIDAMQHYPDRAIKACTEIVDSTSSLPTQIADALANRAGAYNNKKQYDLAVTDCDRAVVLDPSNVFAFTNRGVANMGLDQIDAAIDDFNQALTLNPAEVGALNDRGDAYIQKGDYDMALRDLNEAVRLDPQNSMALLNRAGAYSLQKHWELSVQDLTAAAKLDPANIKILGLRALNLIEMRRYDEAIADCDTAIKMQPADDFIPIVYTTRAFAYFDKGMSDNAIQDLAVALRLFPGNPTALAMRAAMNFNLGAYAQAITDITHSLAGDAGNSGTFLTSGVIKYYAGPPDATIEDFQSAIKLATPADDKPTLILWLHLARLAMNQDDTPEFMHTASKSLPNRWPLPLLQLYRGETSLEDVAAKAKSGDAVAQYEQVCEFDFYVGKFHLLIGHKDEALRLFHAASGDCAQDTDEYGAALAELKRLGG
jgi:lipoprotein NlpI